MLRRGQDFGCRGVRVDTWVAGLEAGGVVFDVRCLICLKLQTLEIGPWTLDPKP